MQTSNQKDLSVPDQCHQSLGQKGPVLCELNRSDLGKLEEAKERKKGHSRLKAGNYESCMGL